MKNPYINTTNVVLKENLPSGNENVPQEQSFLGVAKEKEREMRHLSISCCEIYGNHRNFKGVNISIFVGSVHCLFLSLFNNKGGM